MKLVSVFSFLLMATFVAGQDTIGSCLDRLLDQVIRSPEATCGYFEDYVKCIIRATDMVNTDGAEEELQRLESDVNNLLRQAGLNCTIDFTEIFEDIKNENASSPTSENAGQDTIGDCLDRMLDQVSGNPDDKCPYFEEYVECIIRATDLANIDLAEEDVQILENNINNQMRQAGLNCTIDISEIFDEVRGENTGSTTTNSSVDEGKGENTGSTSTSTSSTTTTSSVGEVTDKNTGINSLDDCSEKVKEDIKKNPDDVCRYSEDYLKCAIRVKDLVNKDNAQEYLEILERNMINKLREQGIDCNIDINKLFNEVKKENGGSTTSPIGWLVVVLTSFLVLFQPL